MKKLLLPILCIGLFFASCDDDDNNQNTDGVTTAKEFIGQKRENAKQEITLNTNDLPKTLVLDNGVKITVKDGTFTKNGTPITGEFTLEVYEMLTPSSIIFSGTNTNYNGGSGNQYLETDGFIYVNAKQNGQYVDERLSKNMIISIPTNKEDGTGTELWVGVENAGENDNQFGWVDISERDIVWNDMGEVSQEYSHVWSRNGVFEFSFGKLGWCNCDVIWGQGKEKTTLTVELTGEVGELASYMGYSGDTFVFFCGKGAPIVAQLYTTVNATTVKSYDDTMPVGAEGKLIAFSVREGIFSFASQNITIEKDMKVTMELKKVSKNTLENEIKSIDSYSK